MTMVVLATQYRDLKVIGAGPLLTASRTAVVVAIVHVVVKLFTGSLLLCNWQICKQKIIVGQSDKVKGHLICAVSG